MKGGWGDQSWEDYGFEILEKSPGLYKVPKLRNLNFCCCTVCFLCLGRVRRGWVGRRGFQRRKDYGLEVLAKTPHCKKFQGYISTPGWMFPHNPGIAGFLTTWFLIHPGMDIYPSKG